jgi:hypothetical protein
MGTGFVVRAYHTFVILMFGTIRLGLGAVRMGMTRQSLLSRCSDNPVRGVDKIVEGGGGRHVQDVADGRECTVDKLLTRVVGHSASSRCFLFSGRLTRIGGLVASVGDRGARIGSCGAGVGNCGASIECLDRQAPLRLDEPLTNGTEGLYDPGVHKSHIVRGSEVRLLDEAIHNLAFLPRHLSVVVCENRTLPNELSLAGKRLSPSTDTPFQGRALRMRKGNHERTRSWLVVMSGLPDGGN